MKVSLLLGLVLGCVFSFVSQAAGTRKLPENDAVKQNDTGLEVSLVADKRKYKRSERISLEVKLINTDGVKDVFVYGTLEFGYSGSLRLFRRDAKGREVPTRFIDEALTRPPEPNNQSAFVKLLPVHFLGTYYSSTIYLLNMEKPGLYRIWVEYSSPISIADVESKPFFGTENGTIKSNVVHIEVLR